MDEPRPPPQLCEDEPAYFGQFSRGMYFKNLAALPWRTQLISGALPLNVHVRPLVARLAGIRRTELQSLLWPHIMHRYNVVFIDNPMFSPTPPTDYSNTMDSGFIVPLLLRISESCARRHLQQLHNEGPLAIVILNSMEEADAVERSIKSVACQFTRDFRVVKVFEMPGEKDWQQKSCETAECCDILIVALHSVMDLFTTQGRLCFPPISLLKVELVVFRNVDVMLSLNSPVGDSNNQTETGNLMERILDRFLVNPDINYVFAASAPSDGLKKIVGKMKNVVCTVISNFFDAVIHEKLPLQLIEQNSMIPWSIDALRTVEDRTPGEKIVMFVGDDTAALKLKKALELPLRKSKLEYDFDAVRESDSLHNRVATVREWWKSDPKGKLRILIMPDKFTTDFGITDADLLVHLSPPPNVLLFTQRFMCIQKAFQKWEALAKPKSGEANPKIPCRILLNKDWEPLLPMILYMANASENSIVPVSIKSAGHVILERPEFLRIPPCLRQLYFGKCAKKNSCNLRHYTGAPMPIPMSIANDKCNRFELRLMRFLNPCHYVVRLIRNVLQEVPGMQYDRMQKDLDERLANLLDKLPEPLKEVPGPDVICGMVSPDKTRLMRVQVLKRIDRAHLHVFYYDEGIGMAFMPEDRRHPKYPACVNALTAKFYPLPEDIVNVPRTWVNLIFIRLRPYHGELTWQNDGCKAVYGALRSHIYEEKTIFEAKGFFAAEDFVFVDNFKHQKINDGKACISFSMMNIFSRNLKFMPNPTHLEDLYQSFNEESSARGMSITTTLPIFQHEALYDSEDAENELLFSGRGDGKFH